MAVADIPPGLLAGIRFILAGLVLGAAALLRGQALPRGRDWLVATVMAVTLIVVGNGFVTWAEQWVPSNQAALLIASSALWTAWFGTFGAAGTALSRGARLGLAVGFAGVALLVWPEHGQSTAELCALAAILLSSVSWSAGAMYGRSTRVTARPLMFAAAQMLIGGVVLASLGLANGELARASWSLRGLTGLAYLTVFGSCLAYGTYVWLIRQTTPARLATIAYVNPAVATVLGWWLLGEALTGPQLAGMPVVLAGVLLVALYGRA